MKREYRLYQVDAFTREKLSGNPAGVIANAEGLTDEEMQKIARELNNSETAFLFRSNETGHDIYTRYFTPTAEVPICGHATIASQYIWALENNLKNDRVMNRTGAGILPVDIISEAEGLKIAMTQGKIEFGLTLEGEYKSRLSKALGIREKDFTENQPIQIVSTGHSKVMVGLKSAELLNALSPDMEELKKLSADIGCNGFYTFVLQNEASDFLVKGRMFAPAIGIAEDPVTGNANGPLGAFLVKYNLVKHNGKQLKFKALQGETIKRPGTVEVRVDIEDKAPVKVQIFGHAVIAFKSVLEL